MDCVSCGEKIDGEPTWATYADHPARVSRTPFPLHEECFERSENVTVNEAHQVSEDANGGAIYEYRERTFRRYRKVKEPEVARG